MLYSVVLLAPALTICLSFFLVYKVSLLKDDIKKLKGDIFHQLNQPYSEQFNDGVFTGSSKAWKEPRPITPNLRRMQTKGSVNASCRRMKREQGSCRTQQSFLQLSANTAEQPFGRGNVTIIPWTIALHQGEAISSKGNKIIVQQDGYYIVFGQVWFSSPGTIMGYIVRSRGSSMSGTEQRSTELLRCLQEMPQNNSANTCYTAGIVNLGLKDELELVIPDRPQAQISMHADSTFFGIIQLN